MTDPAGSAPGFLARSIHGREEALAALSAALDPASAGSALALVGEAGIGKSRLARWAAEQAVDGGWVVVEGRAVLELTEALGVLCDAVRAARRAGLTPHRADPVAARFPATILPELGGGTLAPESLGAVFEGAALYLRGLAGRRGLLLILEDLHWADPTSLRLVSFLARALTPARTTMLLTFRPGDPSAAPSLQEMRRELRRTRLAEEIALEPLTPGESAEMLVEILGRRPPAAIETEIVRLAGGSPFALEELTRAAADSGWLDDAEAHGPGAPLALPFTLTESIRARAGRLDEDARELLRWGAVVGERFDARLLGAVASLSEGETLSRLERCIAAGLVAEDPADASGYGFAFRHALVREALSQEGLTARRRLRHARVLEVGEALAAEGVPISAAELAGHALAAGNRQRTVALSQEAARRALLLGAVEETVAHLEQALALWPEDGSRAERAEMLRETGRLRLRGSRGDEEAMAPLEEALAEFRALGQDASAAWTLALLATAHFEAGRRDEALDEWERAVGSLRAEPGPPLRSALTAYARGLTLNNRLAAAAEVADEGLALVPSAATAAEALDRVSLLATRGMLALFQDDPGGRALVEEALVLATAFHDDVGAARAHHILGESWHEDIAAGIHHLASAAELVGRHGLTEPEAFYAALSGHLLAEAGDWEAAERRIADAVTLAGASEHGEWTRWTGRAASALVALGRGQLEDALEGYAGLAASSLCRQSPNHDIWAHSSCGGALLLLGRAEEALAEVEPILASLESVVAGHREEAVAVGVGALVASGRLDEAAQLAARVADARSRAFLADYSVAVSALDAAAIEGAAARADACGARLDGARLRATAATVLATRPETRAAAADLARTAHQRFQALGSEAWCRRLEGQLRTLGRRAPTPSRAGAGGLSARELEVLRLVAEGLTNREIAGRLVISQNTAIRHVSNIFAKLGAGSRAQAVRLAAERGLIDLSPGAAV